MGAALSGKLGAIDGAAAKLSAASYPFIQSVDWSSDLYSRPLPGASPLAVTKAMDTYNAFAKLVDGSVPAKLFSGVNPSEAVRSYDALVEFASVVKAAQR